jgi:hypothetical protein
LRKNTGPRERISLRHNAFTIFNIFLPLDNNRWSPRNYVSTRLLKAWPSRRNCFLEEDEIMKPISPFLAAFIKMMVPECEEHLRNETVNGAAELPPLEVVTQSASTHDRWR